ncbi:MAG: hypothetical protein ABIS50_06690 [Luteolibacter sp.]|uniref:hypothetical protein n=1 Tax=Luteolibacter sp. TaxID=1962973 RepID=UPI003264E8C0
MKYFRFCASYVSPHTNERYGIFIAVWHLIRDKKAPAEDEAAYWKAREWFEANLPIPPYHQNGNPDRAITWFKESAMNGPIVRKLGIYHDIARRCGTGIELISSDLPGTIIYEDDYQIATIPI